MINKSLFLIPTIISALALGACGGSSSSGGGAAGGGGGLSTGTFSKIAVMGTGTGYGGHFRDATPTDFRVMQLYDAPQITGSGYINAIRFKADQDSSGSTCNDITIRMGHTSQTPLLTTFGSNVEQGKGTLQTVLTNAQVVIPAVIVDDYFTINLDTSFYFNGVDNLIVDFLRTGVCSQTIDVQADVGLVSHSLLVSNNNMAATGGLDVGVNMEFVFAGGDNRVTFDPTGANNFPFITGGDRKAHLLYLASEINGSGPITGIGFRINSLPAGNPTYTTSVRLAHTTLAALPASPSNFADNFDAGSPSTVATNLTFVIPTDAVVGSYIWLPLTGSFNYNGTDNLIVEIDNSVASGPYGFSTAAPGGIRRITGDSGGTATTFDSTNVQVAKFRFNGSTVDRVFTGGGSDAYRWFTNTGTVLDQYMYRAAELGGSGTITKIACRKSDVDSVAATYPNFEMVMSHHTAAELEATVANNVPTPVTVYNGSFDVPAGLLVGDWIEVPLTTNFNYNGTDNLVVQVKADAGAALNRCALLSNAAFANRRVSSANRNDVTATQFNHQKDMRIWMNK